MILILLFLSLPFSLSVEGNRENIVPKPGGTDTDYFSKLIFDYGRTFINGSYYAIVTQVISYHNAPPFDVISYSVLENRALIPSPRFEVTRDENFGNLHFHVLFLVEELTEKYGCISLREEEIWLVNCRLMLKYVEPGTFNSYKDLEYVMVIRSTHGSTFTTPVLEEGCNCIIVEGLDVVSTIYKDKDCTAPLQANDVIEYGSEICLELSSPSALLRSTYFETSRLTLTYSTSTGEEYEMDILGLSNTHCGTPCRAAVSYSVFSLFVVGEIEFYQVVRLDKRRRLASKDYLEPPPEHRENILGVKSNFVSVKVVRSDNSLKTAVGSALFIITLLLLF